MKHLVFLCLFISVPLASGDLIAQETAEVEEVRLNFIQYHKLSLRNLDTSPEFEKVSLPNELEIIPLSVVEENVARNLNSHWAWAEYSLDMIDSYSPFLFRTKKSSSIEEIKVLLQVNSRGRLSGFEVLGDVDKGTLERLDHILRKLPDCKPVPGFDKYGQETFELTIRKY